MNETAMFTCVVTKTGFFFDLIEKALRKLVPPEAGLKNEIDDRNVSLYSYLVSPTKVRNYSNVVTYFILACSANF